MRRSHRLLATFAGVSAVALGLAGPALVRPAGADETTTTTTATTTTSTTEATTTSSTTVGSSSTTTEPGSTTTTAAGTATTAVPESDQGSGAAFGPQPPFDPKSKLPLPAEIARSKREKTSADRALAEAQHGVDHAQQAVDAFHAQLEKLAEGERRQLAEAQRARQLVSEGAVAAYMQGGRTSAIDLLGSADASHLSLGMEMLNSVLDQLESAAHRYVSDRAELTGPMRALLNRQTKLDQQLAEAERAVTDADLIDQAAGWQVQAFEDDSHVWIPGFIFPVEGPTHFVDSFGDMRLPGTPEQHWHEGCDVMAAAGTPLVAVEDGVLDIVSTVLEDPLGGNSITMTGASGYRFYYAHLSAFAAGMKPGTTVTAGEVIGYVGSTGDALAPHVHFEILEGARVPIDAYGILKAAWVARQAKLDLGGTDPGNPPDPTTHPDPGTPAGFPRYPDGTPVEVVPVGASAATH